MKKFIACVFVLFNLFSIYAEGLTSFLGIPLYCNQKVAFDRLKSLDYHLVNISQIQNQQVLTFYSDDSTLLFDKQVLFIMVSLDKNFVDVVLATIHFNSYEEALDFIPNVLYLSYNLKLLTDQSNKEFFVFKDSLSDNYLRIDISEKDGEHLMNIAFSKD